MNKERYFKLYKKHVKACQSCIKGEGFEGDVHNTKKALKKFEDKYRLHYGDDAFNEILFECMSLEREGKFHGQTNSHIL